MTSLDESSGVSGAAGRRPGGRTAEIRAALETTLGMPFTDGNRIELLQNGDEIFPSMLDAIRRAQRRIEFLTFIYWTGDIAVAMVEALSERARAGVEVLVMLDGFGARPMSRDFVERMETAGCKVLWFRPLPRLRVWESTNRTHRKILVCDGEVGFTGGVGIAAEWEGDAQDPEHWRDNHFRIEGPAVRGLRAAFYADWMETEQTTLAATEPLGDCVPAGECAMQVVLSQASVGWGAVARLQDTLIRLARRRVRVQTPYFAPGYMQMGALMDALDRGVEVEFMIPGPHIDKRISEYAGSPEIEQLLEAGMRLWRYQPTMLHSKLVTMDGEVASVGSANFNQRSILKDNEVAVNVLDRAFAARMDAVFDADRARCEPSTFGQWRRRSLVRRAVEQAAGLLHRQT